MSKENGGPAFPREDYQCNGTSGYSAGLGQEGMTLRDYFAAKAMLGVLSKGAWENIGVDHADEMEGMAIAFYSMADAMLKARSAE